MAVHYNREDDVYYERRRIGNQTIELGMNFHDSNLHDRKGYFNIYMTIYNKAKDKYNNMDKKISTGIHIFADIKTAIDMFYNVEAYLLDRELVHGPFDEITIFCTWMDNRRRDAYYKVLHRFGYNWGTVNGEKCISKNYKKSDINPEVLN